LKNENVKYDCGGFEDDTNNAANNIFSQTTPEEGLTQ
jgi:hypothetical protein